MSLKDVQNGAFELYYPVTNYDPGEPFQLLLASEFGRKPNEIFNRHKALHYTFNYVTEGEGELKIGNAKYFPKKNDLFILPKELPHRGITKPKNPWMKLYFIVDGWLVEEMFRAYNLENCFYVANCSLEDHFRKILHLAKTQECDIHKKAAVVFHEILIEINIKNMQFSQYSNRINSTINFLNQNIEKNLRMEDIAANACMSVEHLVRIFKKEVGVTPYAYLTQKRLELSRVYLKSTDLSVKTIAYRLNYCDEFYFSNCFKKYFGISPNQYRNKPY